MLASVLLVVLWTAACAGSAADAAVAKRTPLLTLALCAILAAAFVAQCLFPSLLGLFARDGAAIARGAWWRVVTALFVQDGWLAGGVTNIAGLLIVGAVAEQIFRRGAWIAIYTLGGLIAECVALAWQPAGAGNSVAVCALAGALLVARPRRLDWRAVAPRLVAAAAAIGLLSIRDIHGAGALAGAALGVAAIVLRSASGPDGAGHR